MHPRNFLLLRMAPNTKRCRIIGLLLNWYESTTLFFFFFFLFSQSNVQKLASKLASKLKNNFVATKHS